jgi:hypothetical protein
MIMQWHSSGYGHLRPKQIRGPPLKGRKAHIFFVSSSHRSGRNSWASVPQISVRRCMCHTDHATIMPFFTKIGDLRSGPPPVGSMVSLTAIRAFTGTGGKSLITVTFVSHPRLKVLHCKKLRLDKTKKRGGEFPFTFIKEVANVFDLAKLFQGDRILFLDRECLDNFLSEPAPDLRVSC